MLRLISHYRDHHRSSFVTSSCVSLVHTRRVRCGAVFLSTDGGPLSPPPSFASSPPQTGTASQASRAPDPAEQQRFQASIGKLANVWRSRTSDVIVDRAHGSFITSTDGRRLLDFSCGIAVVSTGHTHPDVVRAIQEQAAELLHGQANVVYHKPMLRLVERLGRVLKLSENDNYFFANSGAEAVEAAIKLARQVTHKQNIIAFQGSFHGRTMGTMAITNSKYIYRIGVGPLMGGAFASSFPYCLHCRCQPKAANVEGAVGTLDSECCLEPLEQLELLLKQQTHPDDVAAIIMEPVLGEGGYVVPPRSFVRGVRELCNRHKLLLIFDEVQTGFGRTGKMFAFEHFDVRPDILVLAKGIASGLPLSAVVARHELMAQWKPGSHGGTYGGNAVSCAAACATLDVFERERLLENVQQRGSELVAGLRALQKRYAPLICDVRGLGLMIGVELDHKRAPGVATELSKAAVENGMLLLTAGVYETLRIIPPLTVSKEEIALGLRLLEKTFHQVLGKAAEKTDKKAHQ